MTERLDLQPRHRKQIEAMLHEQCRALKCGPTVAGQRQGPWWQRP